MQRLQIDIEDWQREALADLARARGMDVEAMAESLLSERLTERMHSALDGLLRGRPAGEEARAGADTIETRLKQVFEV